MWTVLVLVLAALSGTVVRPGKMGVVLFALTLDSSTFLVRLLAVLPP